jgi:ankyrin repeat protein
LLEKEAKFDLKDKHSRTPLSCAALKGHKSIVKLLLEKGAELETEDNEYSQTPLS